MTEQSASTSPKSRKWSKTQLKKFQATMRAKRKERSHQGRSNGATKHTKPTTKTPRVTMTSQVLAKQLDIEIHERVRLGGHIDKLEATAILLVGAILKE